MNFRSATLAAFALVLVVQPTFAAEKNYSSPSTPFRVADDDDDNTYTPSTRDQVKDFLRRNAGSSGAAFAACVARCESRYENNSNFDKFGCENDCTSRNLSRDDD
jgi:hypothetical protein